MNDESDYYSYIKQANNYIPNVDEANKTNTVLDAYIEAYEKRYGVKPLLSQNGADRTTISDITRKLGLSRAVLVVTTFIEMNNEWFVKRNHALDILSRASEVNSINTEVQKRLAKEPLSTKKYLLSALNCDNCEEYFWASYPSNADFSHLAIHCFKCQDVKPKYSIALLEVREYKTNHARE